MEIFWQIFNNWWWVFFPLIWYFPFKFFYFWWIQWEVYYKKAFNWILLEIKPPKEVVKPFSAMENVYSLLWMMYDSGNWRERWYNGALPLGYGGWFSFEICSFGGEIHFFIRIPSAFENPVKTAIFSQYPDAEIFPAEDYTKKVPQNIPNEKWDLQCDDFTLARADHFPIKTYSMFFERPEEEKRVIEEKRVDPINTLLEGLSKLQAGDQIWIQIVCLPITDDLFPWEAKGRAEIEKLSKSTVPVEKETQIAIENKLKKSVFQCWIRGMHLFRKDQPFTPGAIGLVREYFIFQFSAPHLNRLVFFGGTRTKIHYWLKKRRLYLRKRQRFKSYVERLPSYFPWNQKGEPPFFIRFIRYKTAPGIRATCVLSTEELTTIFHFPTKIILPTVSRVEVKKVGPPPALQ